MIVDKDKKFIFIHNPRTGGTAIRHSLKEREAPYPIHRQIYCLNNISRPRVYDENNRLASGTILSKANFNQTNTIFDEFTLLEFSHPDHTSLYSIKQKEIIEQYDYKFVCVRNTWDRLVSYYEKIKTTYSQIHKSSKSKKIISFEEFISGLYKDNITNNLCYLFQFPQTYWTQDADEIINYHDLEHKWEYVLNKCKVEYRPLSIKNQRTNMSKRKTCADYYNDDLIEMVRYLFYEEILLFNFEYDGGL